MASPEEIRKAAAILREAGIERVDEAAEYRTLPEAAAIEALIPAWYEPHDYKDRRPYRIVAVLGHQREEGGNEDDRKYCDDIDVTDEMIAAAKLMHALGVCPHILQYRRNLSYSDPTHCLICGMQISAD